MIPRQILDDLTIRVLLVAPSEEEHASVTRLVSAFKHGTHTVEWEHSYQAAVAAIEDQQYDVCLISDALGDSSGLDLIDNIEAQSHPAPSILLTASADRNIEIAALTAGAADCLSQDRLDSDRLERSIRHAVVHAQTLDELRSAKEAADATNDAKTRFLANVSHDIRTPLSTIVGNAEILLRDELKSTQRDALKTILVASESLAALADGLGDVSKIEAGEISLDSSPFNIRDTVTDVVRIFGLRAEQKGLRLLIELPTSVPETVVGDERRLQQILIDLVSNALKFTERGQITIRVEELESRDGCTTLQIEIADTGVGISEDVLHSIFERSEKASTTGQGTGLGVVRRVVTAMGGEVSARSKLGKGSVFTVVLPFSQPGGTDTRTETAAQPRAEGRVLVMASGPDDRRATEGELEAGGFDPLIVGEIGAAVDVTIASATDGSPFVAIVLDTAFKPFDTASTLAELAGGAAPVTLVVPSGRTDDEPRCREAGIKGYVKKPAKPGVLVDVVRATIAATSAGDTDVLITKDMLGSSRPAMKILVVDDVKTNLMLTVRMLTERGHEVVSVPSGVEAIDRFEQERFDVILMDLQMPGLDGFDTTEAIRADEALQGSPRTPIIALTAHTTTEERDSCVAAGMDGFLSKPVRPDALFAAVEQFGIVDAAA